MSKDFEKIKGFYEAGNWKEKHVLAAVGKGKITEEEADVILGKVTDVETETAEA